jgi:nitroreductase
MADIFEIIKKRRSVRQFTPEAVPNQDLELILDAARYAPTAGNKQPWRFLVVCQRENLSHLQVELEAWVRNWIRTKGFDSSEQAEHLDGAMTCLERILSAPLIIFILVDTSVYPDLVAYDGALAAANLMLAARALGYGTSFQTTFFPEDVVCHYFSIPEKFHLICAIPVGRPVEWPAAPPKKSLAELVYYEHL